MPESIADATPIPAAKLVISSPVRESGRYSLMVRRDEPVRTVPSERVDQLPSAYGADSPGAFVQVSQAGKVVFSKGYGLADLAHPAPITAATVFNLASVSKPFTGMAIAQLEIERKLSIDDDVRKYVPQPDRRPSGHRASTAWRHEMRQVGKDRFQVGGWIFGDVRFVRIDDAVTGLLISNVGVETCASTNSRRRCDALGAEIPDRAVVNMQP